MKFSRRDWLKQASLAAGSMTLVSGLGLTQSLTAAERKKFNPRPLDLPVRLGSNENPYGPSSRVRDIMVKAFDQSCRYPWSYEGELAEMLAEKEGVPRDHIVITGGSTEGLKVAGITFAADGGEIIAGMPTFLTMMTYAEQWGTKINWVPLDKDLQYDLPEIEKRVSNNTKLVFLCNPNNPTSKLLPADQLMDFGETISGKTILFSDEAYYDYIREENYPSMVELVKKGKDVIVSRTFSKIYGMAGLRIGYLIAKPSLAQKLKAKVVAFTNVLALEAAKEALRDREFYDFSLQKNQEGIRMMYNILDDLGLNYLSSHANFVFFQSGKDIRTLQKEMLDKGIVVGRPFEPLNDWCRVSTGTLEEVQLFCDALKEVYEG